MIIKRIRFIVLSVLSLVCLQVSAQDEYRAEAGVSGGTSYYLGDANSQIFNKPLKQYTLGGFFRYRFNTRIAAKAEYNWVNKIVYKETPFKNIGIKALDLTGEFNFFDLEQDPNKRLSKTFSPYIFAGAGMMIYSSIDTLRFTPSIPFGVGFKYILAKRWNLNAQWSTRLLLADDLEGVGTLNNPHKLNGTNFFNNDFLSTFTVGISYDIWKRHCDCENSASKKDSHKHK